MLPRPRLEVGDIFRTHGEAFRRAHDGHLSLGQRQVMSAIEQCRSAALGGHLLRCSSCSAIQIAYNSCRNRHCPKCQGSAARRWLEARQVDLLPVEYYHVVFTLPAPISDIAYTNKAVIYGLLFQVAAETLQTIAADPRHLGARIGAHLYQVRGKYARELVGTHMVSRAELEREVWHGALIGYDAVTSTVIKLRRALEDDARHPRYIATIPKRGYVLIAAVDQSPGEQPPPAPATDTASFPVGKRRRGYPATLTTLLLAALSLLAGLVVTILSLRATEPRRPAESVPEVKGRTLSSIAVLPFTNPGANENEDYFSDGITDDLITELAKIPTLLVISRESSFLCKGSATDLRDVAKRLDVPYILSGNGRRKENRLRVNAQLTDAKDDADVWGRRYEGTLGDVVELQQAYRAPAEGAALAFDRPSLSRIAPKKLTFGLLWLLYREPRGQRSGSAREIEFPAPVVCDTQGCVRS